MSAFNNTTQARLTPPLGTLWQDFDSVKPKTWEVIEVCTTLGRKVYLKQWGKKLLIKRDLLAFFEEFRRVEVEELIGF